MLEQYFGDCGALVGRPVLMRDPATGKCKGVGWVSFESAAAMAQAVAKDGSRMGGRQLRISVATKHSSGLRPSVQAAGTHTPALIHEILRELVWSQPVRLRQRHTGTLCGVVTGR